MAAESFFPRSNGVANSVLKTSHFLKSNGHEVLILAQGEGPRIVNGQRVIRIPSLSFNKFATVDFPMVSQSKLESTIDGFGPDVIHLASPFFLGDQVRKAANYLGIPVVAVYQTDVSGFASFYKLSALKIYGDAKIKKIHSNSDLNLVPSSASEIYLRGLGVSNIKRWTRGVDEIAFNPLWRSEELRKSWGSRLKIGYVGRLAPEKQVEKLVTLSNINADLIVIGDGPSKKYLETKLPKAIFTGHLNGEDLSKAMASLDLLVTTGENETFCQVVQEGMACGLPVIAPQSGGPTDLIDDGIDGFLIPLEEKDGIEKRIKILLDSPEMLRGMANYALNKVKGKTWESVSREITLHYQSVSSSRENVFVS